MNPSSGELMYEPLDYFNLICSFISGDIVAFVYSDIIDDTLVEDLAISFTKLC